MRLFTGSYRAEDTVFLLKPMAMEMVDVAAKERLIQSGQRHYSELLTLEQVPNPRYLALFEALTARYARRLAAEIMARIMEQAFYDLDAPVARVCGEEVPIPYAKHLEDAALPQMPKIVAAARQVCGMA